MAPSQTKVKEKKEDKVELKEEKKNKNMKSNKKTEQPNKRSQVVESSDEDTSSESDVDEEIPQLPRSRSNHLQTAMSHYHCPPIVQPNQISHSCNAAYWSDAASKTYWGGAALARGAYMGMVEAGTGFTISNEWGTYRIAPNKPCVKGCGNWCDPQFAWNECAMCRQGGRW